MRRSITLRESGKFLTELQMKEIAPAVFSMAKGEKVSDRYTHIPTIEIIKGMGQHGFGVTAISQTKSKDAEKLASAKHMIRFRKVDTMPVMGEMHPEIVLVNSHDGTSTYQLSAGIFRLVCSNGMIASDEVLTQKVRHKGDIIGEVVEGAESLAREFPQVVDMVDRWKGIKLDKEEQRVFAHAAKLIQWDGEHTLREEALLYTRRKEDAKEDLWTTFNKVQENMIKGGLPYLKKDEEGRAIGRQRTRGISSVQENNRVNKALWTLTAEMERIKRAA